VNVFRADRTTKKQIIHDVTMVLPLTVSAGQSSSRVVRSTLIREKGVEKKNSLTGTDQPRYPGFGRSSRKTRKKPTPE